MHLPVAEKAKIGDYAKPRGESHWYRIVKKDRITEVGINWKNVTIVWFTLENGETYSHKDVAYARSNKKG